MAVGEYFGEGPVTDTWTFQTVPDQVRAQHRPFTITFAHRTLASWLNAVLAAGLAIEAVSEPRASEEDAAAQPAVAATRVVPLPDHRGQETLRHPRLGRLPVDCAVDEAVDKRAALGRTEAALWMNCG